MFQELKSANNDLNEVPYKPKIEKLPSPEPPSTPPVIESMNINHSLLQSVKKRKLDILKEGGLEVTPVKSDKEASRPTVIHQPPNHLSITLAPDSPKAAANNSNNPYLYVNGDTPPKVLQSKSIYSYSEKTVYGNPKEYFMPPPRPHVPKFATQRPLGGDILDLTLKSPQKPIVEIMRVPHIASRFPPSYRNVASLPVNDMRLGSNLEITLVDPQPISSSKKRSFTGNVRRNEENGRHPPSQHKPNASIPHIPKVPQPSSNKTFSPSLVPNYLTQLSLASKMMPAYSGAPIDPVYFTALQNLYPSAVPPFFSVPTPEQLQFYTELLAHNSQLKFPFAPNEANVENGNAKK